MNLLRRSSVLCFQEGCMNTPASGDVLWLTVHSHEPTLASFKIVSHDFPAKGIFCAHLDS